MNSSEIENYLNARSALSIDESDAMFVANEIRAQIFGAYCDFDRNARERWIRVIHRGRCIALLHIAHPISFIEKIFCFADKNKDCFVVDDFEETITYIDRELFEKIFERSYLDDSIRIAITINDLYALTST